ncbi:MAG: radical SAM protein, partial [Desulfovibrio sp.]|nr:radical SAM protein [Desulfovibrio sp.]
MRTLAVNEFFVTLQGEASFAGTPAVFVRFQGCPVACPWCDTQYAARLDGATLDFAAVRAKQGPGAGYADVEPEALLAAIREAGPRHVVLTGGEPCRHDLTELTSRLVAEGFRVQIETSGTMPIRCHADVWVTLSPKPDMPGGLAVRQDAWER